MGAGEQDLMRTYYSGPDAVVTDAFLTVKPPSGKSFALGDLDADQLRIWSEEDIFTSLGIYFGIIGATSVVACMGAIWGYEQNSWWIGLGAIALALVVFLATFPFFWFRNDTVYVLRGVYRGVPVILYMSSSEAKVFRVWYAVREALDNDPSAKTG